MSDTPDHIIEVPRDVRPTEAGLLAKVAQLEKALAEARNLVRELCCEGEAESTMIAITNKARRFMAKWEQPRSPEGETD